MLELEPSLSSLGLADSARTQGVIGKLAGTEPMSVAALAGITSLMSGGAAFKGVMSPWMNSEGATAFGPLSRWAHENDIGLGGVADHLRGTMLGGVDSIDYKAVADLDVLTGHVGQS